MDDDIRLIHGDCLEVMRGMEAGSVHCCVTSPPYFHQRDYGYSGQIGLEPTVAEYVGRLSDVFMEVARILKPTGSIWINLGDSFNGYFGNQRGTGLESLIQASRPKFPRGMGLRDKTLKNKDLIGIPWRVAFAIQDRGLYLRSDNIWFKPDPKPESRVSDRPHRAHEYIFLFTKSEDYYYGSDSIRVGRPGRSSVWPISTRRRGNAHSADYPGDVAETCILLGCPSGGTTIDPFAGSGTTLAVAVKSGRRAVGIDINKEYLEIASRRIDEARTPLFGGAIHP